LVYPGINRLDYDFRHKGGVFPRHIESNNDPQVASWLGNVIHVLPVAPRPEGYNPLEIKNLDPPGFGAWVSPAKLLRRDRRAGHRRPGSLDERVHALLGDSPAGTVRHRTIQTDLPGLLELLSVRYPGAMYSGCGGGYLYVASNEPVPGAFRVKVRIAS